jgi:hypothetical protein
MKQYLILLITVILICSCYEKKRKNAEAHNTHNIYELSIHEVIKYSNFYRKDTLLVKTEIIHYRENIPKEKELWTFEYDDNQQLITERHLLQKGDTFEIIYEKEINSDRTKIMESEDGDTLYIDQYKYDKIGNFRPPDPPIQNQCKC